VIGQVRKHGSIEQALLRYSNSSSGIGNLRVEDPLIDIDRHPLRIALEAAHDIRFTVSAREAVRCTPGTCASAQLNRSA